MSICGLELGVIAAAVFVTSPPPPAPEASLMAACFDGITTVYDPSWGKVAAPSTGTAYYLLDYASGSVSRLTGNGYAFNDGQNGEYTYNGPANRPISYSVSFGAFTGTGVSVVSSVINGYTDASGSGVTSALGVYSLKIGGTLAVSHGASVESHTSTITVTVNYQ